MTKIVVASRSFARNRTLCEELSAKYSDVTFTESPEVIGGAELVSLLRGHDRAIVGLERIDDDVLSQVPELKVISKYGVGLDAIDVEAAFPSGRRDYDKVEPNPLVKRQ